MSYFEKLNYSLSNEDTRVEHNLLKDDATRVFSICGSGARVLPLIAKNPAELDCVDLAREQLFLCELRLAAARALTNEEYLYFLGYRGGLFSISTGEDDRMKLFNKLELSAECREFWQSMSQWWLPRGFIFLGKWEQHFQKVGKIVRDYLRFDMWPIFEAHTMEKQLELFEKHWRPKFFSLILKLVANEWVFNKFLYKGHFAGASKHRTEARPPYQFLDEEFTRMFTTTLVRKNYFLQLLFLGGIYFEEALPIEAQPSTLDAIRRSKTKMNYRQENLLEVLKSSTYDFVSLSDTISYLPADAANQILQLLPSDTSSGAQVVIRSFLRAPNEVDSKGWRFESDLNRWARDLDTTGVYEFHIYTKE
jgi:S-adenosylmethionine-diacylglycerol 3-amino-3-carboxypropyl transferase